MRPPDTNPAGGAHGRHLHSFLIARGLCRTLAPGADIIARALRGKDRTIMRQSHPIAGLSRRRFLSWASASLALITAIALPARRAEADTASLRTDSTQITADDATLTL